MVGCAADMGREKTGQEGLVSSSLSPPPPLPLISSTEALLHPSGPRGTGRHFAADVQRRRPIPPVRTHRPQRGPQFLLPTYPPSPCTTRIRQPPIFLQETLGRPLHLLEAPRATAELDSDSLRLHRSSSGEGLSRGKSTSRGLDTSIPAYGCLICQIRRGTEATIPQRHRGPQVTRRSRRGCARPMSRTQTNIPELLGVSSHKASSIDGV